MKMSKESSTTLGGAFRMRVVRVTRAKPRGGHGGGRLSVLQRAPAVDAPAPCHGGGTHGSPEGHGEPGSLAEGEGFEPSMDEPPIPVFETGAFNRSATP